LRQYEAFLGLKGGSKVLHNQDPFIQLLQAVVDLNERVLQLMQSLEGETGACYSVDQASKVLGISRAKMYDLLRRPDFPVVDIGHRKLIPRKQLEQWLDQQCGARKQEII